MANLYISYFILYNVQCTLYSQILYYSIIRFQKNSTLSTNLVLSIYRSGSIKTTLEIGKTSNNKTLSNLKIKFKIHK